MNEIKISKNDYFNLNFRNCLLAFFQQRPISSNRFSEINFRYLFNLPEIQEKRGELKIILNEDIDKFKWSANFISSITNRISQSFLKLRSAGYDVESTDLTCSWRLVIGLGASHPQETSMTLHHIYGIPYIPGSAVKGVTRHWAVLKFADEKSKIEGKDFEESLTEVSKALDEGKDLGLEVDNISFKDLIEIFGRQGQQGKVIFFDAFPIGEIKLKIDIMNPHYSKYYSENMPPADWQNPVPIKFLTVENTKFKFYLASKARDASANALLNKAKTLLTRSLSNHGIGAKTALGYGIFVFGG